MTNSLHEDRKIKLQKYLDEYKTLDKMSENKIGKKLYDNFYKHNDDIYATAIELGYKIEDITRTMPKNYYTNHPDILKEKLSNFIKEHQRFPKIKEMEKYLHINTHFISKFGGIDAFKKFINYDDSKDLIDLRGDYNRSVGELITANYFCSQGLKDKYTREQYPFPKEDGYFRSDFTFYLDNNKELHVEVWGIKKTENTSEKAIQYHKVRKNKEKLYRKYSNKITLISIDYEIFDKSYDDIQKYLYKLLSPYVNLKFKNVSYNKLLSPSLLSDEEIFNGIMEISPDGKRFPTTMELTNYNSGLYSQILKRGYTYNGFANKYGVKTKLDKTEWTKKLIFEHFNMILMLGKVINKQTLNEEYNGLSEATEKFGYMTKLKINYFYKINNVPPQELDWIINLANNTTKTTSKYSKKEVVKAKELLDKLYPNINNNICCKSCGKEIIQNHIYELYCDKCSKYMLNGKMKYSKPSHTETEYNNNFHAKTTDSYLLTTKGFNSVSDIKIQSYRNYFNMIWIDVVRKYNKFDELYRYIIDEFKSYCTLTGNQDIHRFSNEHKYITYDVLMGIGLDQIYKDVEVIKKDYSEDGYRENFLKLTNKLGYIPLYKEFNDKTSISINSYSNKFNIHKNIYDEIVKMYSSEADLKDYLQRKKDHKVKVGKETGSMSRIYNEEDLKYCFVEVFDNYFLEFNKYPSRRTFDKISKHDSSVYRKRFNKSWTQICEMYGFNTQQSIKL